MSEKGTEKNEYQHGTVIGELEAPAVGSHSDTSEKDHGALGSDLEPRFPEPGFRGFYRTTLFQILVVGSCTFCGQGIWAAMNGLGVGGSSDPNLVNAANALLYVFNTVCCAVAPWLVNYIGFKWTLVIGGLGYPFYAAGLYLKTVHNVNWLVYVGALTCGVTGGFFWSVEGAVATGYPEANKRGRYLATWLTFRNLGNLVGGAISLGMNVHAAKAGAVGPETYIVFMSIQCLIGFIAIHLSNPDKVRRENGSRIVSPKTTHWKVEAREMWRLISSKQVILLIPLFLYLGWIQAYPGTYLARYFTVRSRALGSLMSAVVTTLVTWLAGVLVDIPWTRRRQTRAITTFTIIAVLNSATWIWCIIIQNEYRHTRPVLDWANQRTFGRGFGVYMFERISFTIVENYTYWCISNLSDAPGDQIRYSSLLRGIETAAVAVSFGVQAVPTALIATAAINCGLWFAVLPFSAWATLQVVRKFNRLEAEREAAGIKTSGDV